MTILGRLLIRVSYLFLVCLAADTPPQKRMKVEKSEAPPAPLPPACTPRGSVGAAPAEGAQSNVVPSSLASTSTAPVTQVQ